jgi:hypothetical protein
VVPYIAFAQISLNKIIISSIFSDILMFCLEVNIGNWGFGLCASCGILNNTIEYNVPEAGSAGVSHSHI